MFNDNASLRRRALHEESQTGINGSSSCKIDTEQSLTRMQERSERSNLVLWWRPLYTIWYFILECNCLLFSYTKQLWHNKGKVLVALLLVGILAAIYNIDGSHQTHVAQIEKKLLWCGYWVVLGIMSSVGLGTGLHTFVLYLGPFIAKVTLAAYECQSLEFPEPPYPSSIGCPGEDVTKDPAAITLWSIMGKVRLEAMMWGAGTAIGELPPYFMARAAKLSGTEDDLDDDELGEILDIEEKKRDHPESLKNMSFMERIKVYMHSLVHKVGFFGILACASIPNPLFDLAGITCGHFLVPFWTFFGATLIGKAVIKMHIQQLIVIFAFSEHHVELLLNLIKSIPTIGDKIAQPFKDYLVSQRAKLHGDSNQSSSETPWLAWIFEKLIIIMVAYFVISIINSFAQNYHKRLCQGKRKPLTKSGGKLN